MFNVSLFNGSAKIAIMIKKGSLKHTPYLKLIKASCVKLQLNVIYNPCKESKYHTLALVQ